MTLRIPAKVLIHVWSYDFYDMTLSTGKQRRHMIKAEIKLDTKLKVYKAVVLPTLLHACETWTVYQRHAKRLHHFHLNCERKLPNTKWQDKIPDTEVLKKARMQSMNAVLKLVQLRWTGHVISIPDV